MPYRIDTFTLPNDARAEFERRAQQTIALLRQQPGFIHDAWFEKVSGDGAVNVITMVEWQDEDSIRAAARVVQARDAASGLDPAAFRARYGIVSSAAVFVDRASPATDAGRS